MLQDKVQKQTAMLLVLPYVHIHKNKKIPASSHFLLRSEASTPPMLALTVGNAAPPLPVWLLVLELEGVALADPAGSRDTHLPRGGGWSPELRRNSSSGVGHSNQYSIVKAFSLRFV